MTRVLIIGGGIAGPVAAMALQRAGIGAVVCEAHAPTTDEEVGSYLTVASNGIDALRAIGADAPVLAAGFPYWYGRKPPTPPPGGTADPGPCAGPRQWRRRSAARRRGGHRRPHRPSSKP